MDEIENTSQPYFRDEYICRINRAIDYIEINLAEKLSLEKIAKEAFFSPFHFHRIFHGLVGETLNRFIKRLRVEKAARMLTDNPKQTVSEIALDCGFSNTSSFSRAFKEIFSMSPTTWRKSSSETRRKICQTFRNIPQQVDNDCKTYTIEKFYLDSVFHHQTWRVQMSKQQLEFQVTVKDLPEVNVAYVRHIGAYKNDAALFQTLFEKLMTWAGPRGLLTFPETQCLSVYHDNPSITDETKLRTSICISVPENTEVDGEVGKMLIPGGKYAVAHFEIKDSEYEAAWNSIWSIWLPESGYQPDDRFSYERYLNNPNDHPEGKHIVDICVPVKPL